MEEPHRLQSVGSQSRTRPATTHKYLGEIAIFGLHTQLLTKISKPQVGCGGERKVHTAEQLGHGCHWILQGSRACILILGNKLIYIIK